MTKEIENKKIQKKEPNLFTQGEDLAMANKQLRLDWILGEGSAWGDSFCQRRFQVQDCQEWAAEFL